MGAIDTATGDGLAETEDEDVPARAPPPTMSQAGANVSAKGAEEDAIRLPTSDYAQLVAEISTHRAELDVLCDHVGNLRSELKLLSDGLRRSNEVRHARRSAASASPCSLPITRIPAAATSTDLSVLWRVLACLRRGVLFWRSRARFVHRQFV